MPAPEETEQAERTMEELAEEEAVTREVDEAGGEEPRLSDYEEPDIDLTDLVESQAKQQGIPIPEMISKRYKMVFFHMSDATRARLKEDGEMERVQQLIESLGEWQLFEESVIEGGLSKREEQERVERIQQIKSTFFQDSVLEYLEGIKVSIMEVRKSEADKQEEEKSAPATEHQRGKRPGVITKRNQ